MKNVISIKFWGFQPSGIRKFFDIVSDGRCHFAWCGELDFDTPWHIRDEGIYSLERKDFLHIQCGFKKSCVRRSGDI